MKLNKKGFVSSAVLYSLLLLFLALILGLLALLSNRKQILDKLKGDIKSEINKVNVYEYYENGTAIYYNPVTGKICGNYSEENSKIGVTEGCLKWYTFNDDKNKATVNMILDHNTSGNVAWVSLEDYIEAGGTEEDYGEKGNNNKGPLTVTKRLNEDTENWKNQARLISADEVAGITGANLNTTIKWNSNKIYGTSDIETQSSWFYFDGTGITYSSTEGWQKQVANSTTKSKYAWLFDNTYNCSEFGCDVEDNDLYPSGIKEGTATNKIYGYWTNNLVKGSSTNAWGISRRNSLRSDNSYTIAYYGVRPVITLSKNDMSDVQIETIYDYTGGEQRFIVPSTGIYKLEVWGAQGGSVTGSGSGESYTGGYGGYSTGNIHLINNNVLYINVGGQGIGATKSGERLDGGYNGGGYVVGDANVNHFNASGGGATHISTSSGLLSSLESKKESILIVSGGGGGARDQSIHTENARWGNGGSGGGNAGVGAISSNGSLTSFTTLTALAGTQTGGYSFGEGAYSESQSAGGSGYYGGYGGYTSDFKDYYAGSGSGGSGYIGNTLLTDKVMYCYECEQSVDENTKTVSTKNVDEKPISNYAKKGNGYAKITYLGSE